jgi:hypothetical protein
MRNKLLISTAALLAGVALASAQNMQGGGEQRGGAAQSQQPQSSPEQGQSQQGPQEKQKQQGQSQRGQKGETTGQAPQGQREQGAQPGTSQSQQQRDPTQGQPAQRQQGQQGQTGQQGQAPQGQAQQGQAGGGATLTTEQRTRVRETVLSGGNVPRVNNVNFSVRVGTAVPSSVRVVEVPATLIEFYPQWRGHLYFVVGDQIIIVDRNHRIIAVIDV